MFVAVVHLVCGKLTFLSVLFIVVSMCPSLYAPHEAIFGPQSTTLISKKRFVSTQYYFSNEGREPAPRSHSHIGVVSIGSSINENISLSATLPLEAERGTEEDNATGVQDVVVGFRYHPRLGKGHWMMGVLTFEPPTGNLEHRSLGVGGGVIWGREQGHWSVIAYGLGRTETTLEEGDKRGNRLFWGGGLAYETPGLPFSPQLGLSWEHVGEQEEDGVLLEESNTSVLMIHPTVMKEFNSSFQAFLVVSVPVAQDSGPEGWQRFRLATGMVWTF